MLKEGVDKRLRECLECGHADLDFTSSNRHGVVTHRARCADCGNTASAFGEGFDSDEHAAGLIDLQMELWAAMHPMGMCECAR